MCSNSHADERLNMDCKCVIFTAMAMGMKCNFLQNQYCSHPQIYFWSNRFSADNLSISVLIFYGSSTNTLASTFNSTSQKYLLRRNTTRVPHENGCSPQTPSCWKQFGCLDSCKHKLTRPLTTKTTVKITFYLEVFWDWKFPRYSTISCYWSFRHRGLAVSVQGMDSTC